MHSDNIIGLGPPRTSVPTVIIQFVLLNSTNPYNFTPNNRKLIKKPLTVVQF